MLKLPQHHCNF